MARTSAKVRPRRIVAAMDATPHADSALEAAAELAAERDAELLALFLEDMDLVRLAALPFAHEIGFASAARRSLDPVAMERTLRRHAEQARRRLEAVAARRPLRWTFQVAREPLPEAWLRAAADAELVIAALGGCAPAALQLMEFCRGSADLLFARSMREIDALVRELRRMGSA